ncbi:MAG: YdcH family protein [Candidatus Rokubacteria bacterium]|nr:YdcH family protein [Candidatus Rokubacteria bacterium]
MNRETLIERLMTENEEFRRLRTEHHGYDQELEALKATTPLSSDQQWRVSELKKLKLMAKDRMEVIIRQAGTGVTA